MDRLGPGGWGFHFGTPFLPPFLCLPKKWGGEECFSVSWIFFGGGIGCEKKRKH